MVRLGNFNFSIIQPGKFCSGRPLREYKDPNPHPDTNSFASCYIETPHPSESQHFRIKIEAIQPLNYNQTNGYGFSIFCDGREDLYVWVISTPKLFENSNKVIIDAYCVKNEKTGRLEGRNLQFQKLEATPDGISLGNIDKESLGTIEISMGEISGIYLTSDADIEEEGKPIPSITKVHEADLKGSSATHCVSLGKTVYNKVENDYTFDFDCTPNYQAVRFYYRSREALQQMGVIPREYSGISRHYEIETSYSPLPENTVEKEAESWLETHIPKSLTIKMEQKTGEVEAERFFARLNHTSSTGHQEDVQPIQHERSPVTPAHEEETQKKPCLVGLNLKALRDCQCIKGEDTKRHKRALSLDSSMEGLPVGYYKRFRLLDISCLRGDNDSAGA